MYKMKILLLMQRYIKLLIFSSLFITAHLQAESMAIFTLSQDFPQLSAGKSKMLFKGKVKRLDNKKYTLIDWPVGSSNKGKFYMALMGQSEAKVNASRAKLIFSGKGYPPKVMEENNFSTLKDLLKDNPNSIGYAPLTDISDEFNILFILQVESEK